MKPNRRLSAMNLHTTLFLLSLLSGHTLLPTATADESSAETIDYDALLFEAAKNEDIPAALEAIQNGADINARSPRGLQTPLMQSVLFGRESMVEFFLANGADT